MANHPKTVALRQFVAGELSATEAQQIDRHLAVCSECRDYADEACLQVAAHQLDSWLSLGYDEALDRAAEETIERLSSLIENPRNTQNLLDELLLELPPARRHQIANDERFHSLKLCQLLEVQCRDVWSSDPASALGMADLAVEVSRHLETARYGSSLIEDARARAWAYLGNAFRINSDLWSSEKALRQAWWRHAQAGEDAYTESEILMFTASLRLDQHRCEEAIQLSDRAIGIYRDGQDSHLEGAALLLKGLIIDDFGRSEEALSVLRAALKRIDPAEDPRLGFAAARDRLLPEEDEAWRDLRR
jgi:tetratricopeptide (TPR) repeat protein